MYRVFSAIATALSHHMLLRAAVFLLGAVGLGMFLMPLPFRIATVGNLFGAAASTVLLVFAAFPKPLAGLFDRITGAKAGRICFSLLGWFIAAGLLYCAVMTVCMLHAAYKKPKQEPAVILVLGCRVRPEGPSLMLWHRIEAAYEAMQKYPEAVAVVSGGQGSDELISEAQCMRDELVRLGISKKRVLMEDKSTTTSENMRFSRKIMEENGLDTTRVMVVTDAYHEMRAQVLAGKEGLRRCSAKPAKTSWYLVPTYWAREWFGLAHAFVFGE